MFFAVYSSFCTFTLNLFTMEDIFVGIILLILGVVAIIGKLAHKPRYIHHWFIVLATVFTAYYAFGELTVFETGEINQNPLYLSVGILFLALIISRFVGENKKIIGFIGIAFPLLYLMLGDTTYAFGGGGFTGADLLKTGVLGAIVPIAFVLVFSLLKRFGFVAGDNESTLKLSIETGFLFFFLFGVSIAGFFLAGPFGLFVAMVTFLASSIVAGNVVEEGRDTAVPFGLSMLLLLPLTVISEVGEADNLSVLQGKMFAGLFLGAMLTVFHAAILSWSESVSGWKSKLLLLKAMVLPILFVALGGMLYFMYESFGGTSTVIAMLIASALVIPVLHLVFRNRSFAVATMLIGSAILIVPYLKHETEELSTEIEGLDTTTQKLVVVGEDGAEKELNMLDLSEAKGDWVVNPENSNLNFTLEASGSKTKGKFKSYEGTFSVPEDWQNAEMNITIPVSSISTFNAIRDESLLSDAAFFEAEKHPVITFKVKGVEFSKEEYLAKGEFTMKKVKKTIDVTFQFIGKGERDGKSFIVLKGSGSLNRTDFGMTPDPGIGDVVNFEFQTEFLAK